MRNIFSDPAAVSLHTISIPTVKSLYCYFISIRQNQWSRLPGEYQHCSLSGLGWTWKPDMTLTAVDGKCYVTFQILNWHALHVIAPSCTPIVDKEYKSMDKYLSFPRRNLSGVFLIYVFSLSFETMFQFYSSSRAGKAEAFKCVV